MFLQWTVTTAEASADPMEFLAIHLYSVLSSTLVKFSKCSVSEVDKVLLSPAFIQVMFGNGLPVTRQSSVVLLPSMTDVLEGAFTISGRTSRENVFFSLYKTSKTTNNKY